MSVLTYNGITLSFLKTHSISEDTVFEGPDYIGTKFTIRAQAVYNSGYSPASGSSPAVAEANLRHSLQEPRKTLLFTVEGATLISSPPAGFPVDAADGPRCLNCTVTHLTGQTFFVDVTYETTLLECPGGQSAVVSHRWTETQQIDELDLSTFTRRGRLRLRTDVARLGNQNADAFREIARIAPPIRPGFKPISSDYTLQADGMALDYTFVYREQYRLPPDIAKRASGTYVESTPNAAMRYGEVRVALEGDKNTDKKALISRAILIAVDKAIGGIGGEGFGVTDKNTFLRMAAIREELWQNKVEVTIKCQLPPIKERKKGMPLALGRLGYEPNNAGYSSTITDSRLRGTAGLALVAAALNDPCAAQNALSAFGDGSGSGSASTLSSTSGTSAFNTGGGGVTTLSSVQSLSPDDASGAYSIEGMANGIYTDYQVKSYYTVDEGVHQMAVSKAPEGGQSTLSTGGGGGPPTIGGLTGGTFTSSDPSSAAAGGFTDTSVFVSLYSPQKRLVVEWVAEKEGGKPVLPSPTLSDPNMVLIHRTITPSQVEPIGDGTNLKHRVAGKYVYGFKKADMDFIPEPIPPWVDNGLVQGQTGYGTAEFAQGILDSGIAGGGGGGGGIATLVAAPL